MVHTQLLEAYLAYHHEVQKLTFLPREHTIKIETEKPIAIAFLSDLHIGGEGTDIERIIRDVELIEKTQDMYLALGGDACDNFILPSMGSAAQESDIQVKVQWQIFKEIFSAVHKKLLFVGSGNHDAWTHKVAQVDAIFECFRDVPTVYTGEGGLINLYVGNTLYRIYRKHRPTKSKSRKFVTNTIVEELYSGPCEYDVGILEHEHQPALLQFMYRGLERVAIRTGTYKVVDAYAEEYGFYPSYGAPAVVFDPSKRLMVPFFELETAKRYVEAFK